MGMKNWNRLGMPKEMKWVKNARRNEMDQESSKQHECKPNDSVGLLELNKGKAYNRPKRGLASTSQIIAWQEHQDGMAKVLIDPQKRVRNGLEKERPTIKQDLVQERSKTFRMKAQRLIHAIRGQEQVAECADEPLGHGK